MIPEPTDDPAPEYCTQKQEQAQAKRGGILGWPRRWIQRHRILAGFLAVLLLVVVWRGALLLWFVLAPSHWPPIYTIGKDTTWITEPRDAAGYMDYEAALNDRLSQGITPETNANVLIWQAIGPYKGEKPLPAEYFRHWVSKSRRRMASILSHWWTT